MLDLSKVKRDSGNPIPVVPSKLSSKTYDCNGKKKLGVGVFEHCVAAGEVAREFLLKIASESLLSWLGSDLCDFLPFFIACHDIGKICPGFQYMLRDCTTIRGLDEGWPVDDKYGSLRHEVASFLFLKKFLSPDLSGIILYHHGYYRQGAYDTDKGYISDEKWETARTDLFQKLCRHFGWDDCSKYKDLKIDPLRKKYIAGLLVFCDYVASDEKFFPPSGYLVSEVPRRVSRAFGHYGFYSKIRDHMPPLFNFEDVFPFTPNEVQKDMAKIVDGPGVYVLEYQMGGGKTEAAIYPCLKLYQKGLIDGLYFGLPTQLTSNKIFDRVLDAFKKLMDQGSNLRLIHSNVDTFHDPRKEKDDWYRGNKRAIVDEFGVGTVDQALLSTLPRVKHFFLRTFGLYRKAVILDELHSYDIYTSELIKSLIKELVEMDCVVVVLSATLTKKAREEILDAV